jgi:hypothetical protein
LIEPPSAVPRSAFGQPCGLLQFFNNIQSHQQGTRHRMGRSEETEDPHVHISTTSLVCINHDRDGADFPVIGDRSQTLATPQLLWILWSKPRRGTESRSTTLFSHV